MHQFSPQTKRKQNNKTRSPNPSHTQLKGRQNSSAVKKSQEKPEGPRSPESAGANLAPERDSPGAVCLRHFHGDRTLSLQSWGGAKGSLPWGASSCANLPSPGCLFLAFKAQSSRPAAC